MVAKIIESPRRITSIQGPDVLPGTARASMTVMSKCTINCVLKYTALAPSDGRKPATHTEMTTLVPNSNPAFSEERGNATDIA
jgi:hypothetical protein